jgi:hypothetical protein
VCRLQKELQATLHLKSPGLSNSVELWIGGFLNLTTLKLLDELFPPFYAGQVAPKGYFWKVVYDPTRIGEDPGLFYGSHFRLIDILPTWDETSPWPDGIIFQHTETGQQLTFSDGQPQYLNYPKKACKLRTRKSRSASPTALVQGSMPMNYCEDRRL